MYAAAIDRRVSTFAVSPLVKSGPSLSCKIGISCFVVFLEVLGRSKDIGPFVGMVKLDPLPRISLERCLPFPLRVFVRVEPVSTIDGYVFPVIGMLTNFPSWPPDRIHNMLKMFVQDPPYDRSLDQLEAFLGQLVAEDKLALEGNQYSKR